MSQPGKSQPRHPPLGDSSADTYGVGCPAPPGRGREEHPGSPTPISCSLRGEPGEGGGGGVRVPGSPLVPALFCGLFRPPDAPVLGMSAGGGAGVPPGAHHPNHPVFCFQGLGTPRVSTRQGSWTAPPQSWEALASDPCPGTPTTCCPALQGGQGEARGKESNEEEKARREPAREPERGRTERTGTKAAPNRTSCLSRIRARSPQTSRTGLCSRYFTTWGVQGRGSARSRPVAAAGWVCPVGPSGRYLTVQGPPPHYALPFQLDSWHKRGE